MRIYVRKMSIKKDGVSLLDDWKCYDGKVNLAIIAVKHMDVEIDPETFIPNGCVIPDGKHIGR